MKLRNGFTLAEVLIAKRESGKRSLLKLSRARELKAPSSRFLKQCAFTLAEVLITLGIIGVIAAITIPTLMNNINDAQYKTAYKKVFSTASQAWVQAVADGNIVSRISWGDNVAKVTNFNAFKSYFKVSKDCNNSNNAECWNNIGDKYWGSYPNSEALAFIDASGVAWSLTANDAGGSELHVDTNGLKKPNKYGQDRFMLVPATSDGSAVTQGLPIKIYPFPEDYTSKDDLLCPSGDVHPCLYRRWLYE